ncbi:MAG: MBL fold metallo-hydrolase [Kiritimatiellae bacterium]|nr:MBL fold metallo-hydrolase [Kiritimatiellia bacterium]
MQVRCHFVDVPTGDCTVLELGGETVVVDCGKQRDGGGQCLVGYLGRLGVTRIDLLVITHAHWDHFEGALDLADAGMAVSELWTSCVDPKPGDARATEKEMAGYQATLDRLIAAGATHRRPAAGERRAFGEAAFSILSPAESVNRDDERLIHDGCMVVCLENGADKIIIASDASPKAQQRIVESGIDVSGTTIYRCAHHGGLNEANPVFLAAMGKQMTVIISTRPKAMTQKGVPSPTPEALARYAEYAAAVRITGAEGGIVLPA